MNLSEYQTEVRRTMNDSLRTEQLANYCMGLAGEAGEVLEPIKKHLFHRKPLSLDELTKELGDVLWYTAAIANVLDIDLSEALAVNVAKLRARYPNGFQAQGKGVGLGEVGYSDPLRGDATPGTD
jgi:NTP pyrophosphatase (non-canonical NTP hydrolase)